MTWISCPVIFNYFRPIWAIFQNVPIAMIATNVEHIPKTFRKQDDLNFHFLNSLPFS